jgi:hypothetical protein
LPGPCDVSLGVTEDVGHGVVRQVIYPFACWFRGARDFVRDKRVASRWVWVHPITKP